MSENRYPPGWDEARVRRILAHYESQSDEEAVGEDEAAFEKSGQTFIEVPCDLVPQIRALVAKREKDNAA